MATCGASTKGLRTYFAQIVLSLVKSHCSIRSVQCGLTGQHHEWPVPIPLKYWASMQWGSSAPWGKGPQPQNYRLSTSLTSKNTLETFTSDQVETTVKQQSEPQLFTEKLWQWLIPVHDWYYTHNILVNSWKAPSEVGVILSMVYFLFWTSEVRASSRSVPRPAFVHS